MEGRVTFINTSAENILGWKERELAGLSVHQAIHHTRPGGENFPQEHCPLVAVLQDVATLSGEEHFIARDGTFIPVSYRAIPLFQDNELVGSLVSFQDVTQRKKAEAQIRLQQAALDAAANMIAIAARNGIIEYVNQAFCHTTGYTPAEVIGKHTRILKSGRQDAAFYEAMWGTILGGAPWEGELVNRRKDGGEYPEQMTITPIFEDGEITISSPSKRDISEEAKTTRLKLVETAIRISTRAF
jgi:PAS domain S-box-containing protein